MSTDFTDYAGFWNFVDADNSAANINMTERATAFLYASVSAKHAFSANTAGG